MGSIQLYGGVQMWGHTDTPNTYRLPDIPHMPATIPWYYVTEKI